MLAMFNAAPCHFRSASESLVALPQEWIYPRSLGPSPPRTRQRLSSEFAMPSLVCTSYHSVVETVRRVGRPTPHRRMCKVLLLRALGHRGIRCMIVRVAMKSEKQSTLPIGVGSGDSQRVERRFLVFSTQASVADLQSCRWWRLQCTVLDKGKHQTPATVWCTAYSTNDPAASLTSGNKVFGTNSQLSCGNPAYFHAVGTIILPDLMAGM